MERDIHLTVREEELMNFIWEYKEPVTSNTILKFCENRSWAKSYLFVMLRSLEKKGMLMQQNSISCGRQYARQFSAAMTKEQYYVALAGERDLDGTAFLQNAVAMVAEKDKVDQKDLIERLRQMVESAEEETEKEKKKGS